MADVAKKTYLIETKNGTQRKLTVPEDWKVTFGPTVPFERKTGNYNECWALRLYESDGKKLRAVITDVKSFRDLDIQVTEKRVRTQRQTVKRASKKGEKNVVAEARIEEWVDPDAPDSEDQTPQEYLRLDYDSRDDDLTF